MISRTDIERRYLPPGARLTEPQWRYVQAFIALDELLDGAGTAFGKSYVRALLIRYLDRDADAVEIAHRYGEWLRAEPTDADRERMEQLREGEWIEGDDATPPAGTDRPGPFVDDFAAGPLSAPDAWPETSDTIQGFDGDYRCSRCNLTIMPGEDVSLAADGGFVHYRCPPHPTPCHSPGCPTCNTPTDPTREAPTARSRGRGIVLAEARRLDAAAGRTPERVPDRVARAVTEALAAGTIEPD